VSALAFTIVALLLSGPVPAMLARASWPMRAPRAAIVLWQSIALAAVLSAFSAGIAIASRLFAPGPDGRPTATITSEIEVLGWPMWLAYVVVFTITLMIGARLVIAVLQVAIATRRRRAHHRMMVDLLDSRVVVSEGTLKTLSDSEISAILTHERAHLRARHDLVLEMFTAVHAAFPRFVRSGNALDAVRLLIEMLADDAAVRAAGPTPLARALVACASGRTPSGALAAGGPTTVLRVRRLGGQPNSRAVAATAYLAAAALLVVPTLALAVPWLTELHRLFIA
jgi:Zn-dependent protease with chaperone function